MKSALTRIVVPIVALLLLAGALNVQAANIIKLNNTTAISSTGSWNGGAVPGASDIGVFDSTITAALTTSGASAISTFGAFQFTTIGGPVTVGLTAGGTTTLNNATPTYAIDASAAAADVTLGGSSVSTAYLRWANTTYGGISVNSGRTLTFNCNLSNNGNTKAIVMAGGGNIVFNGASTGGGGAMGFSIQGGTTVTINGAGAWPGTLTIINGTLNLGYDTALGSQTLNMGGTSSTTPTLAATSGTRTIANGITLAAVGTGSATIAGSQDLTINGVLTVSGASRTLTVNNSGLTTFGSGGVALSDSGTSRTLTINGTGNTTISGVIANGSSSTAGNLTYAGSGTLMLSGANTYGGATAIQSGAIQISGGNDRLPTATTVTLGAASTSGKLILGDGTAARNQTIAGLSSTGNGGNVVGGNSSVSVLTTTGISSYGGVIGGAGANENNLALNVSSGTLTLSGNNTHTGGTTINTGAAIIIGGTVATPFGDTALSTLNLAGGALITSATRTASTAPVANPINLTADSAITTSSTATAVDLNLSSSSISGSAGTLTFRNDAASGTGVFQPRFSSGFTFSRPIVIANGSFGTTLLQSYNTSGNDQTFNGIISGTGGYKRTATTSGTGGNTVFNAANTYSGGTALNDGTLTLGNANALQNSTLTMGGGTLSFGSLTAATVGGLAASTSGTGYDIALVNGSSANVALTAGNNNASTTYAGVLSGGGSLTKVGTGTLTLSSANSFANLYVNSGQVTFNHSSAGGGGIVAANGVTLLAGSSISGGALAAGIAISGASANVTLQNANASGGISSAITGSADQTLTIDGGGGQAVNLNATTKQFQNFYGTVVVSSGATMSDRSSTTSWVNGSDNALFNVIGTISSRNGGSWSLGALSGSGTLSMGTSGSVGIGLGYTIGAMNTNSTFSGTIQDGGNTNSYPVSVTKTGTGTLTLSGSTLTYSGTTTINGGILNITGNKSGPGVVSVANGGTLAGSGSVTGAVTVASGGKLAPGNASVGTLTLPGSLTLSSGSLLTYEFNGTPANDQVDASAGTLTINGGSITLYSEGTTMPFMTSGTYNVIKYSGSIGGTGVSALTVANPQSGKRYSFGTAGGYVTLTIADIVYATWNTDANGNWTDGIKWSSNPSFPGLAGDTATFGTGSVLRTVTLDANETVGAITMNNANSFVIASSGNTLTLNNSSSGASVTVTDGTANAIQTAVVLGESTAVSVGGGKSLSVSGVISGSGALTKNDSGTLTLSSGNTYSGKTAVNGGTLNVSADNNLGANPSTLTTNQLTLNGGTLAVTTGFSMGGNRGLTIASSGGTVDVAASQNLTNSLAISGAVASTGDLTKNGSGTLTLTQTTSDHTYGNLTLNAGTIVINKSTALGRGTVTINNNPTISTYNTGSRSPANAVILNGDVTLNSLSTGTFSFTGPWTIKGATRTITVNIGATNSNAIGEDTAGLGLTKSGASTLTLSGTNTYTGNTTINAGTLALVGSGSISNSGTVTIGSGATLDIAGLGSICVFSNLNTGSGTLALKYSGSPAISAYGTVTLSNSTTLTVVNTTGAPLTAGSYKIISTNNGGSIAGTLPSVAVTGGGTAGGSTNLLKIVDGELYLVVDQPLAATMTVHRTAGLRLLIALADVATNWSNAAGYTPSLAGLNLVTTNGVNLMTNSNWILYTNSPNVNDQISYTIRDSLGWPATGLINVVVDSSVTGTNSIANINIGGSTNAVTAYGIPGYSYILERATNLVPAIWVDVSTNTAATNGVINATDGFIDLGNVPPGSAYYRLKWHP